MKTKRSEAGPEKASTNRPGALLLAGVSGSLLATPVTLPAAVDGPSIEDRIKLIKQRLADPATAKGIAGPLKIEIALLLAPRS